MTVTEARLWRGATKAERAAERRARLIEAGLEVFGTLGFRDATVRLICQQAGLTERYFYESFPNLQAALHDTYRDVADRGYLRMAEAAAAAPPGAALEAGLQTFFADLAADPRGARIQLTEVLGVDREIDQAYQRHLQRAADLVLSVAHPDVPAPASAEVVAKGLIGASVEIATEWLLGGFAIPLPVVVASAAKILGAVLVPSGQSEANREA